jgi:hypothetical protein
MRVILHNLCQIQHAWFSLRYMNCGPRHIQCSYSMGIQASIFSWSYLRCYCRYHINSMRVILQTWCQMQGTPSSFRYVNSGPAHIQSIYRSAYICFNIRWNVSAMLLEIIGHFEARYTANWKPNIAHIIRFTLCEQWSRTYTMYLQLRIFWPQYSAERICAAIGDITTIQCA